MVGVTLREMFLVLLLTLSPLPLASAQDTYYVRPTASEAAPPCEDCLTLSEYARQASTYFNSDNLTLVFLPGEHSLDTTIVFELMQSVLLVGNTTYLPNITSKIVCSRKIEALMFINVSIVEIKHLAFSSCGNDPPYMVVGTVNLDTLLDQHENINPAIFALFIPNFHLTACSMDHCLLPLLLDRSIAYLQNNTFEHNMGYFGGAVAAYNSTLVFSDRNVFQYNLAKVGGGIHAKDSHLVFSGSAVFIGNDAEFGGGGVSAIESYMSYNGSLQRELPLTDLPYEPSVHTYMENTAKLGGGLLLVNSTVKPGKGTLNFTANQAKDGGGVYSIFSSLTLGGKVLFKGNVAKSIYGIGSGGAAYVNHSTWITTAVTFTGNSARSSGGAVYAAFSHMKFTGISCNSSEETDSPFNETGVDTCLKNNLAGWSGGGLSAMNSTIEFVGNTLLERNSAGGFSGGGISALSSKLDFKCTTTFLKNSVALQFSHVSDYLLFFLPQVVAAEGGGLSASSTEITIEGHARFIENSARHGGGLEALHSSLTISGELISIGNHGSVSGGGFFVVNSSLNATGNGTFTNNTAGYSGGASDCIENCSLTFEGGYTFEGNSAVYGGAISVNEGRATVSGKNCLVQNRAVYGGAIFAKESKSIVLMGNNSFVSNTAVSIGHGGYGGGIHAVRTKVIISGLLNFTNNSASYGGGLSIAEYGSDLFILVSQANVLFFSNFAEIHGGAILVEDASTDYCVSDFNIDINAGSCFFKLLNIKSASFSRSLAKVTAALRRKKELHSYLQNCRSLIRFEDNLARQGGDAIYGGVLHVCGVIIPREKSYWLCDEVSKVYNIVTGLEAFAALMNITMEQMTANHRSIASDPFKVCICDNMKPDCSQRTVAQPVYPGETVPFPVVAVGQANGAVTGVVHTKIAETDEAWIDELQGTQSVNMTCTFLRYTLASHRIGLASMSLSAEGPCGDSGISLLVKLSFLSCPVGFALSQFGSCQCGQRLQKYTNSCDIDSRTITRSKDFWLGVDDQSHDLILHPHCPFDYCKLETVSFTLNSTDLQCVDGRSGMLCGACQTGLSLKIGSSKCSSCSNAFLPLFIAFAIAGFFLVMFLFTCKVTVSDGTTSGLIFYANILAINHSVFFPSGETNILTVFIAWLNLDLGIETCLFNGMDMYTWTWLQFVFPFYIWLLVCAITVAAYYSTNIAKLIGPTNPVSVLATLFLLSYTKLIRTIIAIFSFTTLDYPNDRRVPVWAYDGNIGYFEGKHIPLFLAGLLAFLFLFLPYTLLLLFGQCIVAASNHRLLSWASNLKIRSFLDAHHAPYKTQHRYWTGLLLLIRFLLFIISAVISINSPRDPSVNLLVLAITCAGLLTWTSVITGSVYRKWYNNVLESSFTLNLVILAAASYQVKVEGGSQAAVVYTSISVAFLTFTAIIAYHARERIKSSQVWRRFARAKLRLCMETLFHRHHQQPEPIEMAAPPTAPRPPVPTTFVELRESLLESQH